VQYFDVNTGVARFRVRVAGRLVDQWAANDTVPTRRIDSSSSTRRVITGLMLRTGDEIEIEGTPDGGDAAALDYVEVVGGGESRK
jgi:alpha-glucuronidase